MDNRLHLSILQLTKHNGDISQIAGEYFSYVKIAKAITDLKLNGMITDLEGKLEVTSLGKDYMKRLINEDLTRKKLPLILPQYKYFSRKIDKYDIYFKNRDIPR